MTSQWPTSSENGSSVKSQMEGQQKDDFADTA